LKKCARFEVLDRCWWRI